MRRRLLAFPLVGLLVATAALTRSDRPTAVVVPVDRPLQAVSATAKALRVTTNPAPFTTLPPGSSLPTDAQCTAAVRRGGGEVRAGNVTPNATRGRQKNLAPPDFSRVTGDFTGTTDEILQWAACKWGVDEDMVRAQIAKESWWHQEAKGDWTTNGAVCPPNHPPGADGRAGQCPESHGLSQLRWQYFRDLFPEGETSTAYNVDAAYATWRGCFEGRETWLNTVERGRDYAAGDAWGCFGRWFSGRWYTAPALEYIAAVQDYLNRRIWETPEFRAG